MGPVYHILMIPLLFLIYIQDWKHRAVHWILFPLLAADAFLIFLSRDGDMLTAGLNLTFVAIITGVLFCYVALREQRWTNIFKAHFGLGDLLFFIAISPLFGRENFMLFFISGMFFSLILHLIISAIKQIGHVPLAGYLAMYILMIDVTGWCLNKNLFIEKILP